MPSKPKNIRKVKNQNKPWLDRQVQCYPPPAIHAMFVRYCEDENMTKSEANIHMMRCFFASLPPEIVAKYKSHK